MFADINIVRSFARVCEQHFVIKRPPPKMLLDEIHLASTCAIKADAAPSEPPEKNRVWITLYSIIWLDLW
jgi:hypothetical protein